MTDEELRLQEYKEYYAARAARYADNPSYKNSFEAEQKLSDAMQGSSSFEEFKERMGNLNIECAKALIKDETLMEKAHWDKHKEVVLSKQCADILAAFEGCETVQDMMDSVNKVIMDYMDEIAKDDACKISGLVSFLDRYAVYASAVVPSECQAQLNEYAADVASIIKNQDIRTDLEKNFEYRHRRALPYCTDEQVQEYIELYKRIIGR